MVSYGAKEAKGMKAYIFDMDGTMIDNVPYHIKAWKEFSRKYGNELSERDIVGWMGMTNRAYQERILGRQVDDVESARMSEEKEVIYRELYRPHMQPAPGLIKLLDLATAKGVRLAVASGAPKDNINFILDGLDLRRYFPVLVDDSTYSRGKPDPECFLTAARMLGVEPKDCTVFEDAVKGVQAGKAAGMEVIALTLYTPAEELLSAGADRAISSFDEFLPEVH